MSDASAPPLDLPDAFLRHNADPAWLAGLPALLDRLAKRWQLTLGPHFPGLSFNYVAPATRVDGTSCMFKVSRHIAETRTEIEALHLWDGRGAARLLDSDPEVGVLLLERLQPGTTLVELAERDDDQATLIAAGLLRELWRPAPAGHALRTLRSWFDAFDRNRTALRRGERGFPPAVFDRAGALLSELIATTPVDVILHGDHHHFNILTSLRPGDSAPRWRVIDPKGLAGDPPFDICQFLINPGNEIPNVIARRVDIFTAELGLDRARTRQWCFLWAVLQACWDFEDGDDNGMKQNLARADLLLAL